MLLRSLTKHVKDQNWFAVALDFIIVVVGILIAFQITEWNDARSEKRRGEEYLERLISDIEVNLRERGNLQDYYEAVHRSAEKSIFHLGNPRSDDLELILNVYRATERALPLPATATWNEVVSSGDIGLLPRSFVQDGLGDFIFTDDSVPRAFEELSSSPFRKRVRRIIPHHTQKAIRRSCGDVRNELGTIVGFQTDCTLDIPRSELAPVATALRNDQNLVPDLRLHISSLTSVLGDLQGVMHALEEGLQILEEEE